MNTEARPFRRPVSLRVVTSCPPEIPARMDVVWQARGWETATWDTPRHRPQAASGRPLLWALAGLAVLLAAALVLLACASPAPDAAATVQKRENVASASIAAGPARRDAKGDRMPPAAARPSGETWQYLMRGGPDVLWPAPQATASAGIVPETVVRAAAARGDAPAFITQRVASLSPQSPYEGISARSAKTDLVGFQNSAFPYRGFNPRSQSSGYSGGRYGDNRVLVHVPPGFDARKPGVIVVFFHGHGATLSRDVRDRQQLPRQITESGVNAVLVAPQLAYDAADSSAGKFWERGGLKRFLDEAAGRLAEMTGDPASEAAFARMPVVVVAYSGGFVSAAWSLHVGGAGSRVKGLVLLDALYGEMDKFTNWVMSNRSAFFVSAYTRYTKRRDDEFAQALATRGVPINRELRGPLQPGTVAFLSTADGITHRDYVTRAWTSDPVRDVLVRMAQRGS